MKTRLYGWNIMRGLRLVMGLVAMGQAITTRDWIMGLAGGFLLFMALANAGCCGVNGCAIQPRIKSPGIKKPGDQNKE
jgi:hypothetical protein